MENLDALCSEILGAAIEVHRHLGPGLLESAYQRCLYHELQARGLRAACEVPLPLKYRGLFIEVGYRVDMIVEGCVLVENKCLDRIAPVHEAQLLTYLRLSGLQLGYLLNWNVPLMKDGIRRMINNR